MTEELIKTSTLINDTKDTRIKNASDGMKLSHVKDFDDILEVVGSFGRYQKWLLLLIFMPVSFFAAFTVNLRHTVLLLLHAPVHCFTFVAHACVMFTLASLFHFK